MAARSRPSDREIIAVQDMMAGAMSAGGRSEVLFHPETFDLFGPSLRGHRHADRLHSRSAEI